MRTLRDTISNVMEEMFFLIEETPPDTWNEVYDFSTSIENSRFHILIFMHWDLANEITRNFLGISDEPEEEDITDCLQEVLNMVTGNFVGKVFPDHEKLLPFPKCKPFNRMESYNDTGFEKEFLFFRFLPLKILYREQA